MKTLQNNMISHFRLVQIKSKHHFHILPIIIKLVSHLESCYLFYILAVQPSVNKMSFDANSSAVCSARTIHYFKRDASITFEVMNSDDSIRSQNIKSVFFCKDVHWWFKVQKIRKCPGNQITYNNVSLLDNQYEILCKDKMSVKSSLQLILSLNLAY